MIIGSAIKFEGIEIRVAKPGRHVDCFNIAINRLGFRHDELSVKADNQGFYDVDGKFYNRKDAMIYVKENKQPLIKAVDGEVNKSDYLFS